ncbi:uncharacterized protein (DUF736 family) [Aminobacter ciceronei]|uniref:Uncharacterized protein (DUF736 family) n=1 Tax=Aminobacter ciceronei TaxID=150723 RepID=A0ABR6CAK1_9HYPH|nr:uncharacterized protein (DUF736 family) [Aminobacter ciceronei]MBA9022049.1 uncharacterized protein (DUF736 family) [Aminobacter ciceronei]
MGTARENRRHHQNGYDRHFLPHRERLLRLGQDPQPQRQDGDIRPAGGDNEKGPDFRIFAGATDFGAAWKKTSREGGDYHSVKLDDPSFPAPIYASLVETDTEGEFSLIWSRRTAE